ncbi:M16 family metallopeptidase [Salinarimonas soli]|uniref:Insulinase family protein n=1 Tax=Salinarimonas soli TaxID=1638099 RepID=A0A5B2V9R4_9HYPH|nr:pitrilysin family protein [Salinarimonas soli]KAA2235325.1 insulinase family protein [Salinarimonas soli]
MRHLPTSCLLLAAALALAGPVGAQPEAPATDPAPAVGTPPAEPPADLRPAEVRISDRVVLVRDPTARSIQFTMMVRAGCADEPNLKCRGIAHYLEHLILVGRNPDHKETAFRFFPEGSANGWTSDRTTAYVHRIPKRETAEADLEKLFSFYGNRLKGFEVSPEDAERERNVVLQEYNLRLGGNPFAQFQTRLNRLLLPHHPLGEPVIGTRETIKSFTVEEAKAFHKAWYVPNNAFFVVSGDISELALKGIVERTLGGAADQPLPERAWRQTFPVEPLQAVVRDTSESVRRRTVVTGKIVAVEDDNPTLRPARSLLVAFLRSQLPGSPHDVLVERENVTDAVAYTEVTRLVPGVYRASIGAEPHDEADPERLADALRKYWKDLAATGIDERNLDRLKRRFVEGQKLADRQGDRIYARIVDWIGMGNEYDTLAVWPRRIAAVTVADVNRLIRAIAGEGREVAGILLPGEPKGAGAAP